MTLLALQRDFRRWLTSEAPDAAARIGGGAAPGLAVYLNNYRSQLLACLAENYDKVRAWLGDDAFNAAAADHIDRLPPSGWTLDDYSLDFAASLDRLYPDDREVSEIAYLERDLGLAFVGPNSGTLDREALREADWDDAILAPVPTFLMRSVTTNAAAIWSAIDGGNTPPAAEVLDAPAYIATWRHGLVPAFRTLEALEAVALAMIINEQTFGEMCTVLAEHVGEEAVPATAGSFLARWLEDGIIEAIR
jgi:hypothetical protein